MKKQTGALESAQHANPAAAFLAAMALLASAVALSANTIAVPNSSFESPVTAFANTNIDSWQRTAQPAWYVGDWQQLTGEFQNTTNGSPDHIDNCDGDQAAFLFAVPEVGLFQDYDSVGGTNTTPTHDFNATYDVGKSYHLTVGVIGGGFGMMDGVTMQIALYYRDGASNMVPVAATTITNFAAVFSNRTHFVDYHADLAAVLPGNPCVGQHMGVLLLSTVGFDLAGGYWDVDNVRLTAVQEPFLVAPTWTNGQFQFSLLSEPGLRFEILAATNLAVPLSNWSSLTTLTNATGAISFAESPVNFNQRFYVARQLP